MRILNLWVAFHIFPSIVYHKIRMKPLFQFGKHYFELHKQGVCRHLVAAYPYQSLCVLGNECHTPSF